MTDGWGPGVGGGTGAFARILADHGPALARLVALYQPDRQEREDRMQEILFAIWRALPGFRGACSERTFVYRIAHKRALTHRHRSQRRRSLPLERAAEVRDPRADPEGDAVRAQRYHRLLDAVRRLSPLRREVVILRLEGLTVREVAEVLGVTENSVAVRLTRARKALSEMLGPEADR